ncbi:hypothetical protein GQ53DRAFT_118450 [Thozetella sp. PMI_491]|nr:hypothetical protein GQ53DRAFT_118450 [Thozetella sp. PMI_491]
MAGPAAVCPPVGATSLIVPHSFLLFSIHSYCSYSALFTTTPPLPPPNYKYPPPSRCLALEQSTTTTARAASHLLPPPTCAASRSLPRHQSPFISSALPPACLSARLPRASPARPPARSTTPS